MCKNQKKNNKIEAFPSTFSPHLMKIHCDLLKKKKKAKNTTKQKPAHIDDRSRFKMAWIRFEEFTQSSNSHNLYL